MQHIDAGGPPPMPPGSHLRFRRGGKKGFWGRFAAQGPGYMVNVGLSVLGLLAIVTYLAWKFVFSGGSTAKAEEQPAPPAQPVVVATVPPLETPPATPLPVEVLATSPLEPVQVAATATFQAAISRPAGYNNPEAAPFYVGVVTYEAGCTVSNIGFTTAGLNGQAYYLYFTQPLDRDPLMQMVNITGYVQKFEDCQYPVLMVQNIFWMNGQATPAPLAIGGQYTSTITNSIASNWGGQAAPPTPFGVKTTPLPPGSPAPTNTPAFTVTSTATPWSQTPWEPQPWPTVPNYGPQLDALQNQIDDIQSDINAYKEATKTPTPTNTPTATLTPTPARANIVGNVVTVAGCAQTNLAVITGPGEQILLMLSGATLPANGQPSDYHAVATGQLGVVCDQPALWASSISWYLPTITPTPTTAPPTATPTPTTAPTNTATPEPTATSVEASATPAPTATALP